MLLLQLRFAMRARPALPFRLLGENSHRKIMKWFVVFCGVAVCALFTSQAWPQEKQELRLVQTIPLPAVHGRLDHMGVDLEQKRLFVAAVDNQTLEVLDLNRGRILKSLGGFKDTQDALFLGGNFNRCAFGTAKAR